MKYGTTWVEGQVILVSDKDRLLDAYMRMEETQKTCWQSAEDQSAYNAACDDLAKVQRECKLAYALAQALGKVR